MSPTWYRIWNWLGANLVMLALIGAGTRRILLETECLATAGRALQILRTAHRSSRETKASIAIWKTSYKSPFPAQGPALTPYDLVQAFPHLSFDSPVDIRQPPEDPRQSIYVLEHPGRIYAFQPDSQADSKRLFLDLSAQVWRVLEAGAMGFAFHPEYGRTDSPNCGYFYVFYVLKGEKTLIDRLSRFEVPDGADVADPNSELVLIEQDDEQCWHNGGCLQFGPDNFLYVSVGDEGGSWDHYRNSQQISRDLFGGILRIDVDRAGGQRSHPICKQPATGRTQHYYIPSDNPFVGQPGVLEEFWAIGLRAPHRFAFDRTTGEVWCGDVGQMRWEEINRIERGGNYQWCYREGRHEAEHSWLAKRPAELFGREIEPVYEYFHSGGNGAIIGGYVYRGSQLPALVGKYVFGDCNSGRIWAIDLAANAVEPEIVSAVPADLQITSFGESVSGELFVCAQSRRADLGNRSTMYRLERANQRPVPLPQRLSQTGIFQDLAALLPHPDFRAYEVNVPFWSDGAEKRRWMFLNAGSSGESPPRQIKFRREDYWSFPEGTVFVKHFEVPDDELNPTSRRRLETRVLVRDAKGEAYGLTYMWQPDGMDAELISDGQDEEIRIRASDGSVRTQVWHYPSRLECRLCHNAKAGYVLGVRTEQLNRPTIDRVSGRAINQLAAWQNAGLLKLVSKEIPELDSAYLTSLPRYAPSAEASCGLHERARSYIAANCSYCHQDNSWLDMRLNASFQGIINGGPNENLGIGGACLIKPGLPEKSVLLLRIQSCDPSQRMPPLGRNLADPDGARLVEDWIRSLAPPSDATQQPAQ